MKTNRILTATQAKAVYDAMCAANNISATVHVRNVQNHPLFGFLSVHERADGRVIVSNVSRVVETYDTQADFCAAYGV